MHLDHHLKTVSKNGWSTDARVNSLDFFDEFAEPPICVVCAPRVFCLRLECRPGFRGAGQQALILPTVLITPNLIEADRKRQRYRAQMGIHGTDWGPVRNKN